VHFCGAGTNGSEAVETAADTAMGAIIKRYLFIMVMIVA
jgi:hypothetical protein